MTQNDSYSEEHAYDLQHIVANDIFPSKGKCLYVRHSIVPSRGWRHTTDTYINLFHKRRWQALTGISQYCLKVICRGKGRLELHASLAPAGKKNCPPVAQSVLLDACTVNSPDENICWLSAFDADYDFFFLAWEEENEGDLLIDCASYAASSACERRNIRMAVVTTTYRRKEDIQNLICMYHKACENMPELAASSHLFIINNEQMDDTFLQQYAHPQITIVTNAKNLGGSGGFAEGARLVVESGSFSHILFMDDDALTSGESWFRTLRLAGCLRQELHAHPLSGTMFIREHPVYCHAIMEALDTSLHRHCLSGNMNMEEAGRCITTLAEAHDTCMQLLRKDGTAPAASSWHPYAAWWYCLFPVETFITYGYPAPYFFCGDDQEFGLRIRRTPLFLNGICVWHPSFRNKGSALRSYLSFRNYILRCIAHMPHWCPALLKRLFFKVTRCLAANDYEKAALHLLSVEDAISFSQVPREGEKLSLRVQTTLRQYPNKESRIFSPSQIIRQQSLRYNLLPMLGVLLTLGGALVPAFWRRGYTIAPFPQTGGRWASRWTAYSEEDTVRGFQAALAIRLSIKSIFLFIKIIAGYLGR